MNRPLKIAIYSGEVPSTTFIERLIEGLASSGIFIYRFGYQKKRVKKISNIFYFTYSHKFSKLFVFLKYSLLLFFLYNEDKKKLDKIIKKHPKSSFLQKVKYYPVILHKPDVFHLQWAKGIADWIWVQDFGIKLIVSLRGAHINYSPIADVALANVYKKMFPKVNAFHAVSNAIAKESEKYNAEQIKIKTIYSGLNLSQFTFNEKIFNTKSSINIVSVGRAHWVKGYSYALDAMSILNQEDVEFNYTIIGVKKSEELLYKRHQYQLEHRISFVEKLHFSEVRQLMENSDILLLPSVEEGIANVVLEAMSLGTLVVSTDCGGMNEVITDTKNGYLVPIRNPEAIVEVLKRVIKLSKEEYLQITKEARKTIENQHSKQKMISEMQKLYHSVLKSEV